MSIGSKVQLFTDDYLVEHLNGVRRTLNPAGRASLEPVVTRDKPWEGNNAFVRHVYYDRNAGEFRMWYITNTTESRRDPDTGTIRAHWLPDTTRVCYAVSKDGLHWDKPSLGLTHYEGSTDNNILPPDRFPTDLYGFVEDANASTAERRFIGMRRYMDRDPERVREAEKDADVYYRISDRYIEQLKAKGNYQIIMWDLYFSPDGFTWTPYEGNPVVRNAPQAPGWAGPTALMGWDPIRKVYAVYMEPSQHARSTDFGRHGRLVGRAESPDLINWGPAVTAIVPDERDNPTDQFYNPIITTYHGIYLGMVAKYRLSTGAIFPEFVTSRDGYRFDRRFREPFLPLGEPGTWDSKELYPSVPIWVDDTVYIFYHGRHSGHEMGPFYEDEMGTDALFGGIGLATLPRDRFVSLDGAGGADVTTRTFTFEGNRLYVNVAGRTRGMQVRVQVLGPASHIVPGHTFDEADPITADGVDQLVTWKGNPDVGHLEGKAVKLRISLWDARLYSFQFRRE